MAKFVDHFVDQRTGKQRTEEREVIDTVCGNCGLPLGVGAQTAPPAACPSCRTSPIRVFPKLE